MRAVNAEVETAEERETRKRKEARERILLVRALSSKAVFHSNIKTVWDKSPWK